MSYTKEALIELLNKLETMDDETFQYYCDITEERKKDFSSNVLLNDDIYFSNESKWDPINKFKHITIEDFSVDKNVSLKQLKNIESENLIMEEQLLHLEKDEERNFNNDKNFLLAS